MLKRYRGLIGLSMLAAAVGTAQADGIKRTDVPNFPIASSVLVPGGSDLIFLSGTTPPVVNKEAPKGSTTVYGDTETQAFNIFTRIQETLKAQGLTMGDVVLMHVYLVGDPAKGGAMDFEGMMKAYTKFFGTAEQPNKPARSTVQIAGLVVPGMLVEIEVVAAKAK
ncbi:MULTISPECIES: RidA family protein [unclassified Azospirillum]|uniref:RidA family protein n=1 Tax=unclassified Azospirillum TaxID=2630922 RepID=UPI000B6A3831|nr:MULTISPECIES: RidA family protein [unclassified Azospirillum]SNT18934.1 Enamine deaminase RidA, house cleaning of reactive enamine intermediates, YjgF/YER057c/UK114 family [Azospirillum sp. RU38E]SNT30920.1 Enamine deaminase RidA, house cleaning of reactive enamine intermediates, YjgF/YER057c/UK114 family [Azospirillum sp. RU37A]